MGTRMIAAVLGCCLLVVAGPAGAQYGPDETSVASLGQNIIQRASEQERIRTEMAGLTKSFRALVDDMKSNGDLPAKKADEIGRLVEGISSTDANHVRKAADLLRKAYVEDRANDVAARQDSLGAAGGEVQNARDRLNALLRMAKALRAGDMIQGELDSVIRAQEALLADTTRVGKEVLAAQEKLSLDPAKIADDQENLAERASAIKDLVGVALSEEMTSEGAGQLKRAMAFLDAEKIDARMHMAARHVEQRDMLPGLGEQKEALLALKQLLKILGQDDVAYQKDLLSKAKDILSAQTELRTTLEAMNPDQFNKQAPELNIEQKDLEKLLDELRKDLGNEDVELPEGEEADEAMDESSDELTERHQKDAIDAMKRAEEALGEVIESVTQTIPEDENSTPGTAEPQNMQTMAQEGHSQGMRSSPGDGEGTKKPGKGEGQAKGGKAKPTTPTPNSPPDPNGQPNPNGPPMPGQAQKGGPMSLLGNTNPFPGGPLYGVRAGEAARGSTLGKRDQMALDENFSQAQNLPREYREMLKAYYDKLSRER